MKRTQKTHLRKFGGVWCLLTSVNDAKCEGCFLFLKENSCPEIKNGNCYPKEDGGLLLSWSQWKEIGEI